MKRWGGLFLYFALANELGAVPWLLASQFEAQGNYYEAITEYRRLLFSDPSLTLEVQEKIKLHIGDLYLVSGNLTACERWYQSPLYEGRLRQLDLAYALGQEFYPLVLELIHSGMVEEGELARLQLETARAFLARGQLRAASQLLELSLSNHPQTKQKQDFLRQALQQIPATYSKANLFWAVIPGGAYLALGKTKLAWLSFLTVSSLTTLSAIAFSHGFWVTGFLAAGFALRYYLDSLYQSFKWLQLENERILREYRENLLSATGGMVSFTSNRLQLLRTTHF